MDDKRREVERDGLITCGDVGYIDADGYLFLCDRVRDMVISGGVNIYPAEIEAVLIRHAGRRRIAPCSASPTRNTASARAHTSSRRKAATLTADDVQAWSARAHRRLQGAEAASSSTRALPREDSGKIFKRKLRAPYWEKAGRQI